MVTTTTVQPPPLLARRPRADWRGWVFVGPFMVVFALIFLAPLVYAIWLSLFREQLVGGTSFVWLDNYIQAASDPKFWEGFGRVLLFLLVQVPIMLGASLLLALLLDSGRLFLERFVRLSVFVPYAVPAVIAALMWGYLYGRDFGPFAQVARAFGMTPIDFLSNETMLFAIMNIVTWSFVGYNMIIMYASLRSIPTELYEAARIDGASELKIATRQKED